CPLKSRGRTPEISRRLSSFRRVAREGSQVRQFRPRRRIVYANSVRGSGTKRIYRVWREDLCLDPLGCDTVVSRPRKSSVPRLRPFKVAESRLTTVPVRYRLEPRAASTSLVNNFAVRKKLGAARWSNRGGRGREQWRRETRRD